MNYFVHDSSIVDSGASIGVDTKVWHFCHVSGTSSIGERCTLGQNVYVGEQVQIGNGVKIQNNVSIYTGVSLEDDVFCGPSCVFTNDLNPRSAHPKSGDFVSTTVKKGATLGANATIVAGVTIGKYALVGAGSVVTKDVPDFAVVYGNPAKVHGTIDEFGAITK